MSNKINFIHIPKNAGVAIQKCDAIKHLISKTTPEKFGKEYQKKLLAVMARYNEHHGYGHARWRDLLPEYQKNKSFAVVRNPWSKVVSRYMFFVNAYKNGSPYVKGNPLYKMKSFEEFLEERHEWGNKEYFWHRAIRGWYQQKDHVTDIDNNLRVDVLRQEYLQEDMSKYFNMDLLVEKRNVSNTDNKDYRHFYTAKNKKIIEDWYAEDIEFFGFTFDGPATKNIWNKE